MKTLLIAATALLLSLVSSAQITTEQRQLYSDTVYYFKDGNLILEKDIFTIQHLGNANDSSTIIDIYDTTEGRHFIIRLDTLSSIYARYLNGYDKPFLMQVYQAELSGFGPIVFTALMYPEPKKLIHSISFGVPSNYVNFKLRYTRKEIEAGKLLPTPKPKK